MHREELTPIHDSDQETIIVNESELKKDISQLVVMGILTGIVIGATIVQWIIYFS
jgi:hypothetical protein